MKRFVLSAFAHADPIHLLGNMAALITTGRKVHALMDCHWVMFLALYAFGRCGAALTTWYLRPSVVAVGMTGLTLGASGAISSLQGALILMEHDKYEPF